MEIKKSTEGTGTFALPSRFLSYPPALADWTPLQRAEFQVFWATLPYGATVAIVGNMPAILDLNAELLAKYPRPA